MIFMSEELTELKKKIESMESFLGESYSWYEEHKKSHEETKKDEATAKYYNEKLLNIYKRQNEIKNECESRGGSMGSEDVMCALAITKRRIIKEFKYMRKMIDCIEAFLGQNYEKFKEEKFSDETDPEDENERDDIKLLEKDE